MTTDSLMRVTLRSVGRLQVDGTLDQGDAALLIEESFRRLYPKLHVRLLKCFRCKADKPEHRFERKASAVRGRRGVCMDCDPPATPEPEISPRLRHAMCSKKRRYTSEAAAIKAALRSAKRTPLIRIYQCPICKGYHLTHKEAKAS